MAGRPCLSCRVPCSAARSSTGRSPSCQRPHTLGVRGQTRGLEWQPVEPQPLDTSACHPGGQDCCRLWPVRIRQGQRSREHPVQKPWFNVKWSCEGMYSFNFSSFRTFLILRWFQLLIMNFWFQLNEEDKDYCIVFLLSWWTRTMNHPSSIVRSRSRSRVRASRNRKHQSSSGIILRCRSYYIILLIIVQEFLWICQFCLRIFIFYKICVCVYIVL
jgi:hypothetical protein